MVRHKLRWLLVCLDFEEQLRHSLNRETVTKRRKYIEEIDTTDILRSLRDCIAQTFGSVGSGATSDLRVQLYDKKYRIVIVRVPRDVCNLVRSSITLLTNIKGVPAVASVVSVNGSARTSKLATQKELNKRHLQYLNSVISKSPSLRYDIDNVSKRNKKINRKRALDANNFQQDYEDTMTKIMRIE